MSQDERLEIVRIHSRDSQGPKSIHASVVPIMTEQQLSLLSLLPFYEGWGTYNRRLVAAIAPLTGEQLALPTTQHSWSIGMYVTHIVANRAWFFHARMAEGGDELTPYELWALGVCEADVDPLHSAAELVVGLEKTWGMIESTLARRTPAHLEQLFPPLDQAGRERHAALVKPALQPYARMWLDAMRLSGQVRPALSLQSIIWGVLEHDIHHGSEISTILGAHGLPVLALD